MEFDKGDAVQIQGINSQWFRILEFIKDGEGFACAEVSSDNKRRTGGVHYYRTEQVRKVKKKR